MSQRIVEAMRSAELPLSPSGFRLTASVGFAMLSTDGDDVDALLDSADRHIRRAKSSGTDRWDAVVPSALRPLVPS